MKRLLSLLLLTACSGLHPEKAKYAPGRLTYRGLDGEAVTLQGVIHPQFPDGLLVEHDIFIPVGEPSPQSVALNPRQIHAGVWPQGKVPYVFDATASPFMRENFLKVTQQITQQTGIQFMPRTSEKAYLRVMNDGDPYSCWSWLGMNNQEQNIDLGCVEGAFLPAVMNVYAHEIGHALGLLHEHTRPDRDDFVNVHFENIMPGTESNFMKGGLQQLLLTPYQPQSVMHYQAGAFSRNGQPTITSKNPNVSNGELGKGNAGFTVEDVVGLKKLYSTPILVHDQQMHAVNEAKRSIQVNLSNKGSVPITITSIQGTGALKDAFPTGFTLQAAEEITVTVNTQPCTTLSFLDGTLNVQAAQTQNHWNFPITLVCWASQGLVVDVQPTDSRHAKLRWTSTLVPSGDLQATVTVNGQRVGFTPQKLPDLSYPDIGRGELTLSEDVTQDSWWCVKLTKSTGHQQQSCRYWKAVTP